MAMQFLLHFDKRPTSKNGLIMTRPYPPLGLEANDRLEQHENFIDIGTFHDLETFPVRLVFWRGGRETLVNYRCPLWDKDIGRTPVATIGLDLFHTFFLGPLQTWCREALWALMQHGPFGATQRTEREKMIVAVSCIKHELFTWYAQYDRQHQGHLVSRVSALTPKTLGVGGTPKLKTKAMETWGIALFLVSFLPKFQVPMGETLVATGRLLVRFYEVLKRCGPLVSLEVQQLLLDIWKQVLALARPLEIFTPKAHLMLHIVLRASWMGSPAAYTTFLDEALNSNLKSVLHLVHQTNFERQGLAKFGEALARPAKRKRLR